MLDDDSREIPIPRGDVYCSPRCGFNCKRSAFDQATQEANELAATLGEGWTPNVWENCGWQYNATKGEASVTANSNGSKVKGGWSIDGYCVIINIENSSIVEDAEDPNDALGQALHELRTLAHRFNAACDEIGLEP